MLFEKQERRDFDAHKSLSTLCLSSLSGVGIRPCRRMWPSRCLSGLLPAVCGGNVLADAGEGRGAVATCLQSGFAGARLRGERMHYEKSPMHRTRLCHHALHIDMPCGLCTSACGEQAKHHVIPSISLPSQPFLCANTHINSPPPHLQPPWAPSNPYLSFLPLSPSLQVKAATLHETSASKPT